MYYSSKKLQYYDDDMNGDDWSLYSCSLVIEYASIMVH